MPEEIRTYKIGEKTYNVPVSKVDGFLKRKPEAVLVNKYELEGKKYAVPETDLDGFLSRKPDAKLVSGSKKKASTLAAETGEDVPQAGLTQESPLQESTDTVSDLLTPTESPKHEKQYSDFRTAMQIGQRIYAEKDAGGKVKVDEFYKEPRTQQQIAEGDYGDSFDMLFDSPETSTDYILQRGATNSLLTRGIQYLSALDEATKLNKDNPFDYAASQLHEWSVKNEQSLGDYDPSMAEDVASALFGLGLDMGPFAVMGGVAKMGVDATAKAGAKLAPWVQKQLIKGGLTRKAAIEGTKKGFVRTVTSGAAQSGGTLGQYHLASDILAQLSEEGTVENFDVERTIKEFGKGSLLGLGVGVLGAGAGTINQRFIHGAIKNNIIRDAAKLGITGAATTAEGGLFELGATLMDGDKATRPTLKGWVENTMVFLTMKGAGVPTRAKPRDIRMRNVDLSQAEIADVNKGKKIGESVDVIVDNISKNSEYARELFEDPTIPWKTKAKLSYAAFDMPPDYIPMVSEFEVKTNKDGKSMIETRDADGAVIERTYYQTKDAAMRDAIDIDAQLKEGAQIYNSSIAEVGAYVIADRAFKELGHEDGLQGEKLTNALKKKFSERTNEEQKVVDDFVEVTKKLKAPEVEAPKEKADAGEGKKPEEPVVKEKKDESVPYVEKETSEKYADLTETPEGDYVFFHRSPKKLDVIDPKKAGTNKSGITSNQEAAAMSTMGGVSMFYTNKLGHEKGAGENLHAVRVPKEKVYDANKDPLNFREEAERRFKEKYPDQAFTPNHEAFWITKIAGENGYDISLSNWRDGTRAHAAKELKPESVPEYTENRQKGLVREEPISAAGAYRDVLDKIRSHKDKAQEWDELYSASFDYSRNENSEYYMNKEKMTELVEQSNLPEELKAEYKKSLETEDVSGRAVMDIEQQQAVSHETDGGSTYTTDGKTLSGTEGASVSIFPERTKEVFGGLKNSDIKKFKEANKDLLEGNEDILAIGTLYDAKTNTHTLDVVTVKPKAEAVELGKQYNQRSVFDLKTGELIDAGGTGKPIEGLKPEAERIAEMRAEPPAVKGGEPPAVPPKDPPVDEGMAELPKGEGDGKETRTGPEVMKDRHVGRETEAERLEKKGKKTRWEYLIYDQLEPWKKSVLRAAKRTDSKEARTAAERVVSRKNLERGSKAATALEFTQDMREMGGGLLGGLTNKKIKLVSDLNDVRRTMSLYNSREVMGKDKLREEEGMTKQQADDFLMKVQNKDKEITDIYGDYDPAKIMEVSDKFNDVYRRQLDELLEENIITKAAYDKIVFEHPYYSPRKYMDVMEGIDKGGSLSGVESLKGGSEGAKIVDAPSLLFEATARKNNIIARARTMRAIETYLDHVPADAGMRKAKYTPEFAEKLEAKEQGDPWVEPEFEPTPKGMEPIDYIDASGKRQRLFIDENTYKYFEQQPFGDLTRKVMNVVQWVSLSKPLKMAATGYNPEFLIKNIPLDMMHIMMTTDAYTGVIPIDIGMMAADMGAVAKDAATQSGRYKDYVKYGGGMDMLSAEGQLRRGKSKRTLSKLDQAFDAFEGLLAYPGKSSEVITRLALMRRSEINLTNKFRKENGREPNTSEMKEITIDAVGKARNYLDFEQGGRLTKQADSVIPYLNAGMQVTRGSLRAVGKNPILFSAKVAQLAVAASAMAKWNMGLITTENIDEETAQGMRDAYLNDISDDMKARNFIVMTPKKYEDASGNIRYKYWKFQKDNMQELITGVAEDRIKKLVLGDEFEGFSNSRRVKELQTLTQSFANVGQLPPLVRGALGYKLNKDFYYNSKIWPTADTKGDFGVDKSQEHFADTPERYKALGKIPLPGGHRLSPVRSRYVAKQFLTESNIIGTGIGALMDRAIGGMNQELKTDYTPDEVEKSLSKPFERRFTGSTYPGAAKRDYDTHLQDYNKLKKKNDDALEALIRNEASMEDVYKHLHENVLEEGGFSATANQEYERLNRRFENEILKPATTKYMESLKYQPPIPRAEELFDQWLIMSDTMRTHLVKEATEAEILTDNTFDRFVELVKAYNEEVEERMPDESEAGEAKKNSLKNK